jgi:hypothetical protein
MNTQGGGVTKVIWERTPDDGGWEKVVGVVISIDDETGDTRYLDKNGQIHITPMNDFISIDEWNEQGNEVERRTVARWKVLDVVLPDWLAPLQYLQNWRNWNHLWNEIDPLDFDEVTHKGLLSLQSDTDRTLCIELLNTKNFRSTFRASLCDQLKQWLHTPEGTKKFRSPFSDKQWDVLYDSLSKRHGRRY